MDHYKYMECCLELAQEAFNRGEIPIGALVVFDNKIIGEGYNLRDINNTVHEHAEIVAMNKAAEYLGSWNLEGCKLYVSVEPCPMCAGAAIQSRIESIVYGTNEPNSGALGSAIDLSNVDAFNHKITVVPNILSRESADLMVNFFKRKRKSMIKVKKSDESLFEKNKEIRIEVFVNEQKVPIEEEMDQYDLLSRKDVVHISAIIESKVVGTARYIKKNTEYKIGRVAVLKNYRKYGVGKKLLEYIHRQAVNNGIEKCILDAQLTAIPFYEKNGYSKTGSVFLDAGIEHIKMIRLIKKEH